MSNEQKKYLSALAVSLLGKDAESAAEFVKTFRPDRDDPERPEDSAAAPEDLTRRVWNAQVQTLFPLIMLECRKFIDRWRAQIEGAFDYASRELPGGLTDTNSEPVESPDAMEVATIRYLMHRRRRGPDGCETEDYILYVPDENARSFLELLYVMRNRIAHGKVCPVEEVARLLSSAR